MPSYDRLYRLGARVDDPVLFELDRILTAPTEPPPPDEDDEPSPSTVPIWPRPVLPSAA